MNYEQMKKQWANQDRMFKNQNKVMAEKALNLAKKTDNKDIKLKAMKLYHHCEQASR